MRSGPTTKLSYPYVESERKDKNGILHFAHALEEGLQSRINGHIRDVFKHVGSEKTVEKGKSLYVRTSDSRAFVSCRVVRRAFVPCVVLSCGAKCFRVVSCFTVVCSTVVSFDRRNRRSVPSSNVLSLHRPTHMPFARPISQQNRIATTNHQRSLLDGWAVRHCCHRCCCCWCCIVSLYT